MPEEINDPEFKTLEEERAWIRKDIDQLRKYRNNEYVRMAGKVIPLAMLGTLLYFSWQMGIMLQDAIMYLEIISNK